MGGGRQGGCDVPVLAIEIGWDPNLARIGGLLLTWHGLFTALGILAGVQLSLQLVKVTGYDYDDAYELALVGIPSGIIGARLLFVAEAWDYYGANPGEIIRITEGGISIWGAILGGVGGALAWGLWKGYPAARGLDLAAFGIILGQGIGRLGDLVNGEHLAKATDLPWGVIYTHSDSPAFVHSLTVGAHHPATTYEMLGDFVILALDEVIENEVEADALGESRLRLSQQSGLDAHDSFVTALRERAEVRVFEDRIASEDEAYGR